MSKSYLVNFGLALHFCSKSTGAGMQALNSSVLIANNNISKSNLARFDLAHAIFDLAGGILIIQKVLTRS